MEKIEISENSVAAAFIGDDGNIHHYITPSYSLINEKKDIISYQYRCIADLGNDHFAVGKIKEDYNSLNSKFYWGIIRVNRDSNGVVLPFQEMQIVPYLYDKISNQNITTVIGSYNGKLTYLDLDKYSESYGKQLVPCILDYAEPFDLTYENFAGCSINGVSGYLPRECQPQDVISGINLLEDSEAQMLEEYYNGDFFGSLDDTTITKFLNLTGVDVSENNSYPRIIAFRKIKH